MASLVKVLYDKLRARELAKDQDDRSPESGTVQISAGSGPDVSPLPSLSLESMSSPRKAKSYELRTENGLLFLDLRSRKGILDPRVGQIAPAAILNFSNRRIGMVSPVILDLDDDGLELRDRKSSKARFDLDGDGKADDTGWVGRNDGFLVIDRNGDGKITSASELSFLSEDPEASSDLEALAKLDSNRDQTIDSLDTRFAELRIWRDRNGNGRSDAGELHSLADHKIKSLSLSALAVSSTVKLGSNALLATSTFTRTDGSIGTVGDVALAFRPSSTRNASADSSSPDSATPTDLERGSASGKSSMGSEHLHDAELTEKAQGGGIGAIEIADSPGADGLKGATAWRSQGELGSSLADRPLQSGYNAIIESANARLVQALASFGSPASMMTSSSQPQAANLEGSDWMTVASLPSVAGLLKAG